jgi:dTDP-4-dehydrorhamnose reductase
VARTHAYGCSADDDAPGYAQRMFAALASHTPLVVDGRRHATPILATDLAELLWRAYGAGLRGVFHMAGAERTSLHRFALELATAMDVAFRPRLSDAGPADAGQDETSLSSKRARRALALATPMLREGLARFVAQEQNGWRQAWRVVTPAGAQGVAA